MYIQILDSDDRGLFAVRVNDLVAPNLCRDEALSTVVTALFGELPLFSRSYADHVRFQEQYGGLNRSGQLMLPAPEQCRESLGTVLARELHTSPEDLPASYVKTLIAVGRGMLWSEELHDKAKALEAEVNEKLDTWRNFP